MRTPFKFNISLKIFLGYFLLVGLAAWFVLAIFVNEVKPGVRQAMEDSLVDTSSILAELAANDIKSGKIETGEFSKSLARYQQRATKASIWSINKKFSDFRVYIVDAQGIVTFDSAHVALGQDYSQWNDVYLTLQGKYGARSSVEISEDKSSDTIMYVAAPIMDEKEIIGSLTVAKPNRTVLPFIERSQQKIIQWGALLFILSLTIGSFFTWRFTRKINKLREYATLVSKGDKATPPTSSNDELSELALAMQSMRTELDGKQYVQESVQHLTHELKSPITAIQGALELISPNMPADKQAHFISQIKAQTARVRTIIQNMLGLAALEHQEKLEHTTNISLKALIQTQLDHLESKAKAMQVNFSFTHTDPIYIQGEAFLLGQAIYNLLENALDFSPAFTTIIVQLKQQGNTPILTIQDVGTGIPDYALEKVFDKFYSLPRPNNNAKSTGLGLNFVKEVAKLHGGTITLKNRTPNGAEAILTLHNA